MMPPLPNPAVQPSELITKSGVWAGLYTADQMIAYGKVCRGEALEEAAVACDGEKWGIGAQRTSTYMETFNKACDDCIGIIRRMV